MPTVDENIEEWGRRYDWSQSGDDWSEAWGGTEHLWWGTVHPRIRGFLPAGHVLEIAPGQLAVKLAPEGVAFLHHSNSGSFAEPIRRRAEQARSAELGERLIRRLNRNWRSEDMTAERFAALAAAAGLRCVSQETVNWLARLPNDCFSVVTRDGSKWDRPPRVERNLGFMNEIRTIRRLSELYPAPPAL